MDKIPRVDLGLIKVYDEFKIGIYGKLQLPGKDVTMPGKVHITEVANRDLFRRS